MLSAVDSTLCCVVTIERLDNMLSTEDSNTTHIAKLLIVTQHSVISTADSTIKQYAIY